MEFFVFDCDCLPHSLSLFLWSGVTFPLVTLDKISIFPIYYGIFSVNFTY